jgi:hypothetical protein
MPPVRRIAPGRGDDWVAVGYMSWPTDWGGFVG